MLYIIFLMDKITFHVIFSMLQPPVGWMDGEKIESTLGNSHHLNKQIILTLRINCRKILYAFSISSFVMIRSNIPSISPNFNSSIARCKRCWTDSSVSVPRLRKRCSWNLGKNQLNSMKIIDSIEKNTNQNFQTWWLYKHKSWIKIGIFEISYTIYFNIKYTDFSRILNIFDSFFTIKEKIGEKCKSITIKSYLVP